MDVVINGRFLTQRVTGVQRYAHELVSALDVLLDARPDLNVTVACPRLERLPAPWRNIGLRQVGRLHGHAWEQLELPRVARGKVLFCPGNTAPVTALFGSQRVVVTVHDLSYRYFPDAYSWPFRKWYGFLIPLILQRATAIITVSQAERRAIIAHYPVAAARLHAIQNGGLPPGADADTPAAPAGAKGYALYVGSLSKRKNFPALLQTAGRLARERGLDFVFVGAVPKGIADTTVDVPDDVAARIRFVGQIDDIATLIAYYRHAACFVFPSLYEASPFPPIEAMACGCPVVASDIESLRERCDDAAVYCNPHDIDSISAAIVSVLDDPALRASLVARGHRRAAAFNWETCARQTLQVLTAAA